MTAAVDSTPLLAFLERLQEAALASFGPRDFDPKLYVDLFLKSDLASVKQAFDALPRSPDGSIPAEELKKFIAAYFGDGGKDLVSARPADFVPEPADFLPEVRNPVVRAWALKVHALWSELSRRVDDSVRKRPDWHTLLPLPGPVVIPGTRFREVYYWDSYWVIRGLLASKMYETAKTIVNNLIDLLDTYGHVPNGARVYYTNRSQRPLLSAMIRAIYEKTTDKEFVLKYLPALQKEHKFWTSDFHQITVQDRDCSHKLSRYYAMWDKPRPESSTIDKESASKLSSSEKQKFYRELASAAESGWDFSTRWMRNPEDITTLATTSILPVDLNIYMLRMELDISFFGKITGKDDIAERFSEAAKARQKAVSTVFWNEGMGQWLDYWVGNSSSCMEGQHWDAANQNKNVFASNFLPLWIDVFNSDMNLVEKVAKSLRSSGLLCDAGIATSLKNSRQQWDLPNGWAPLQHMIAEGLSRSESCEATSLKEDIYVRWIRTNYAAYIKTGEKMHEKYDVQKCGEVGGGGEYEPQTGFGWSNGVVLAFLDEFGWPEDRQIDCQ